jgi:predicted Rossmann fold nucleotide-binding protein DprA/Smf involved in DNA uptake
VLAELGAGERSVAEALLAGRTTADDLVAATELPVAGVLGILTLLELRGLVSAAYGRYRPAGTLASR